MRLPILLCFIILSQSLFAQVVNPKFDKVAKRFEQGKFESALESADALIDNDKHRKHPEPYLWASMCYYQIHLGDDESVKERVKSPLRNALKYAGKAVSKDKEGDFVKANSEYLRTMKVAGLEEARAQEQSGDFRKASYTYKQLLAIDSNDPFLKFYKGVMDIKLNSLYEAEKAIAEAFPELEKNYSNLEYVPDPVSAPPLKENMMYYMNHLVENALADSAKDIAGMARVFFPLDEDVKAFYNKLQ